MVIAGTGGAQAYAQFFRRRGEGDGDGVIREAFHMNKLLRDVRGQPECFRLIPGVRFDRRIDADDMGRFVYPFGTARES